MSQGWHFIGDDLGIRVDHVDGMTRVTVTNDWADCVEFDEFAAWGGLLGKHARFADYCDREGAS